MATKNKETKSAKEPKSAVETAKSKNKKLKKKLYEKELERLQTELVKLQEWVRQKGLKVVVILKVGMLPVKVASSSA